MPAQEIFDEGDWNRLHETIKRGGCILLLGPGVAVDPNESDRTPLTTLLARSLAEELGQNPRIVNTDDLAHVCQVYKDDRDRGRDRVALELAVSSFYEKQYDGKTTALHRALARLPIRLCINTTPDFFMERAFREEGKEPRVEYYHYQEGRKKISLSEPDAQHPLVFDLCGNRRDKSSLVLTESDLLDFLVSVISKKPPLPPFISSRFSDPKASFLFMGFGFRNWHLRILLRILKAEGDRSVGSLALEEPASFDFQDLEQRKAVFYFKQEHRISVKHYSCEDFIKGLIPYQAAPNEPNRKSLPIGAPVAFLSYVHEDQARVQELKDQLEIEGVKSWIDTQNLRGGDEWDQKIAKVLEKVNYVVVVQSASLDVRIQSYVHKEVKIALGRQEQTKPGYRFIIPISLGFCEGLEKLKNLQTLDLNTLGVKELAQVILEDWSRRISAGSPKALVE